MNEAKAVCPQCNKEVTFVKADGLARCPDCGFQYELREPPPLPARENAGKSTARTILGALFKAFLILCALAVVLIAVLFAGCLLVLKGR